MVPKCAATLLFVFALSVANSSASTAQNKESPELAESLELNSKVVKLFSEAKYDEALPLAKRALELREKALGPTHGDLIPLLTNLGEIYKAKKQPAAARSYFERALTIAEKTFPESDVRIAHVLDKLGLVAYENRQEKDAGNFFQRSLEIKEKALGPDSIDAIPTLFNLAEIYRLRGDYQKAEPLYEQLIRIREKDPNAKKADLVRAMEGYLSTLVALKKTSQADDAQKRLSQLLSERSIQGGVLNGKAIKLVQPEYPTMARIDHASGQVRVQIVIDENGKVISARAINSGNIHPALLHASEEAARRSLFTPTFLSGAAVRVSGVIIYNFAAQ